jgi:phosphate transport system ATP-binding protein
VPGQHFDLSGAFPRGIADRVMFLHRGRLIEHGDAEQVFTQPTQPETAQYVAGRFG